MQEPPAQGSILIVDDDPDVRDALCALLSAEGYTVESAVDGVDALERLDAGTHYSAIICDLDMPRLGGVPLLHAARRRMHDLVVVILSGRFDLLASMANLGLVYAVTKPFEGTLLTALLRQALAERS